MPQWLKLQTEVVNVTEQRYNLHDENLLGWTVWVALTTLLKRSLVAYSLPCSQYIVFVEKLRRTQVIGIAIGERDIAGQIKNDETVGVIQQDLGTMLCRR